MNIVSRFTTARAAREDAELGVDAKDRRMTADLGLSPADVDRNTQGYRRALQEAADTSRLEELRDEERRAEDLQVLVGDSTRFTLALLLCGAVEFAGAILIMKSLGVSAAHRIVPAFALTATLIAFTHVTVKATAPRPSPATGSEPSGSTEGGAGAGGAIPERVPFEWRRFLFPVFYGVLVIAIALVRVLGSNAEEVPLLIALSEAILMIAVSVGPAFVAAWLETQRAPAVELARRIATLKRRIRREEKRIGRAEEHLASVDGRLARWTQENARRRALYATEHELSRARQLQRATDEDSNPAEDTSAA